MPILHKMSRRLPWKLPALLERLPIDIAPSVLHALHSRSPLVALESTLISHGLNPPHSLALPRECNAILTDMAVTPAAIGIIHGRLKVGLTDHEIDHLAIKGYSARQPNAPRDSTPLWKVGRRELAAALVNVSSPRPVTRFSNILIHAFISRSESTEDSLYRPHYI